jgi:hypothetical protein
MRITGLYINCTKTNTSGQEENSKVIGELYIRNSAKYIRTLARRIPDRDNIKVGGDCLPKTQL